jgi:hypothetical protein
MPIDSARRMSAFASYHPETAIPLPANLGHGRFAPIPVIQGNSSSTQKRTFLLKALGNSVPLLDARAISHLTRRWQLVTRTADLELRRTTATNSCTAAATASGSARGSSPLISSVTIPCIIDRHASMRALSCPGQKGGLGSLAAGQSAEELFGLHPEAPMGRHDRMGLNWMLKGERVVALTITEARLSGGLTFHRHSPIQPDGVSAAR